jgi:hypothetical protein
MGVVSLDQHQDEPVVAAPHPVDPVLASYTKRMHRLGFWYAGALALVVVAVLIWVTVVMAHSEIAHAKLRPASAPAPSIPAGSPSSIQQLAWSSGDQLAIGDPFWVGTIVTFSAHTLSGRNASTGAVTWTYTRSDMTICEAVQEQGQAIAVFNREGNCDEIDAFDTDTGARSWTRTLDSNGQTTNGIPTFAASQYTLLLTTPSQVQAIVPSGSSGGLDRWNTNAPPGCTDVQSVLGPNGVLISQNCKDGHYLELRDAYAEDQVNNQPNPKLQLWRVKVPTGIVPVSADALISAYDPSSGELLVYADNGATSKQLPLDPRPNGKILPQVSVGNGFDVVWIGGQGYQISTSSDTVDWTQPLHGPPSLNDSTVLGVTDAGIGEFDAQRGALIATYSTPPAAAGSAVFPVGTGFVVGRSSAGGSGTAVYR